MMSTITAATDRAGCCSHSTSLKPWLILGFQDSARSSARSKWAKEPSELEMHICIWQTFSEATFSASSARLLHGPCWVADPLEDLVNMPFHASEVRIEDMMGGRKLILASCSDKDAIPTTNALPMWILSAGALLSIHSRGAVRTCRTALPKDLVSESSETNRNFASW